MDSTTDSSERAAFEAWRKVRLTSDGEGGYTSGVTNFMWAAWQARATGSAATAPTPEPAGECVRLEGYSCGRCGCADVVKNDPVDQASAPAQPLPLDGASGAGSA